MSATTTARKVCSVCRHRSVVVTVLVTGAEVRSCTYCGHETARRGRTNVAAPGADALAAGLLPLGEQLEGALF